MSPITDALGRLVSLKAPAERVVVGFEFEEFIAVAEAVGWDRVVGFDRHQWETNRHPSWVRDQAAIRRLATIAILHDVDAAARFADSVALLNTGWLAVIGTPTDTLRPVTLEPTFDLRVVVDPGPDAHLVVQPLRARRP